MVNHPRKTLADGAMFRRRSCCFTVYYCISVALLQTVRIPYYCMIRHDTVTPLCIQARFHSAGVTVGERLKKLSQGRKFFF